MSGTEDFYRTLGVDVSADESAIRRAYKKRSLETHPDRFPVGSQAQREATGQFQGVNNAYYVLSDPARRREYDASRVSSPHAGSGGGSGFSSSSWWKGAEQEKRTADAQFESVFEEMMADEAGAGASHGRVGGRMYGLLGGGAGAVLGFIVAVSHPLRTKRNLVRIF